MNAPAAGGGFTLIELLLVIAVVGILLGIGVVSYVRWRATSAVLQGVQELTQVMTTARTGAKRLNVCQEVRLGSATGATTIRVGTFGGTVCTGTATKTTTYAMPGNVTISLPTSTTNSVTFQPPYGTTGATARTYTVAWASNTSIFRTVRVTGLFGKVILQ